MMKAVPPLRRILFYVFALIYVILCPLIVARMLGFSISPLTYHLVKTGLVYVSTVPPQATVYVDGRLVDQKTPTAVRDLPPGKHFIRIELDGYNDWGSNVTIVERRATLLTDVPLSPQADALKNKEQAL